MSHPTKQQVVERVLIERLKREPHVDRYNDPYLKEVELTSYEILRAIEQWERQHGK